MLHDRQPETEPPVGPRGRLIGLSEPIEDKRHELRPNPDAGIREDHGNISRVPGDVEVD
jgi:hypothetical protein